MIPFIIKMLVQKYVSVRFPASVTEETATEDAEAYFESHAEEIALKIPMIIGRFGTEGELSHSENGVSMTYKFGDPLYDVFPNVVPLAEVL